MRQNKEEHRGELEEGGKEENQRLLVRWEDEKLCLRDVYLASVLKTCLFNLTMRFNLTMCFPCFSVSESLRHCSFQGSWFHLVLEKTGLVEAYP